MIEVKISWEHDPSSSKWLQWQGQENSQYYLHNLSDKLNQWFEDNNIYTIKMYEILRQSKHKYYCNGVGIIAFEDKNDAFLFKLRYNE